MVFVAFALLVAKPVGEKTEVTVDEDDRDYHVGADAKSSHAAEESDQQTDAAEKFGCDGQNGQYRGNVHLLSEEAQRGPETESAEPAQDLLRAVREEHDSKRESKKGHYVVVGGVHELLKRGRLLLYEFEG